jgi:hypothetical protein
MQGSTADAELLLSQYFPCILNPTYPGAPLIGDFRDVDGRPLAEMNASEMAQEGVEFKMLPCTFEGFRRGHPTNVSAMKQIGRHWPELLDLIAYLRSEFLHRRRRTELTLLDMWHFGAVAVALPGYLAFRQRAPFRDGAIPGAVSALYKTTQGVQMSSARAMILDEWESDATVPALRMSGRALDKLEFASMPFTPGSRVCGGPQALIDQFFDVVTNGRPSASPPPSYLIDDMDDYFAYAFAVVTSFLAWALLHFHSVSLLRELSTALAPLPSPTARHLRRAADRMVSVHSFMPILTTEHITRRALVIAGRAFRSLATDCDPRWIAVMCPDHEPSGEPSRRPVRIPDGYNDPEVTRCIEDVLGRYLAIADAVLHVQQSAQERINRVVRPELKRCELRPVDVFRIVRGNPKDVIEGAGFRNLRRHARARA